MHQETASAAGRLAVVEARPGPVEVDLAAAAVVVVDMQNDFAAKGGGNDLAGIDISVLRAAIAPTARVLAAARRAGVPVVYLRHEYLPDLSDMGPLGSKNQLIHTAAGVGRRVPAPDGSVGRILVRGTWNTEIVPELAPEPGDTVLSKTRFSGFHATGLDAALRRLGVRDLLVTGCTTSVCLESTVRDAMFRDYRPLVLADCTGEIQGEEHHESTLVLVERLFGWVARSADLLRALGG
ncbi:cysteine hydrolase family protein [Marinitenerispora sediminis]|uniref:Cysteine hydrolase n=1 Tax=Marinitenerispora sediminis TaxID=1931232 RepID=A0A368TAD9_9ACTN|nr:isochorismatase family cysteine hydrolase [Marinitenerispora sediminis]RCV52909.1 cysteine hydrolase [Marinitenerispora sediminis]RCV60726.1 cysteine hydrolase [Marinitenerispora sediminis]RCV61588.1 cysteine hydrolase [Marinitenerispora sediminis]